MYIQAKQKEQYDKKHTSGPGLKKGTTVLKKDFLRKNGKGEIGFQMAWTLHHNCNTWKRILFTTINHKFNRYHQVSQWKAFKDL